MKSSLEIAQEAELRPIKEIAERCGLEPEEVQPYGPLQGEGLAVGARAPAEQPTASCVRHRDDADQGRRGQDDDARSR